MKISETWALLEDRTRDANTRSAVKSAFAAGVRAVAVELLMHSKDVLNADDSARLYARLMTTADRVER